jgi:hypothetical protein
MSQVDETKILRGLLVVFLVGVTVALSYFGFTMRNPFLGLLIPLIGIAAWFVGRPTLLFCCILIAKEARLFIPGLPGFLDVSMILQCLLIGWVLLDVSIKKQPRPFSSEKKDIWLAVFALNLLLIMWVRGAGFALLGSSVFGGTGYVVLLLTLLFYFSAVRVKLDTRHVKILLWCVLIGSLVPALVEIFSSISPGSVQWTHSFIKLKAEMSTEELIAKGKTVRWSTFSNVSLALLPIAYVWMKNARWRILIVLFAGYLMAMTGFRNRVFQVGVVVLLAEVLFSKDRAKTLLMLLVVGIIGLGILMVLAPHLPLAVQRAVSMIEFIPVDPDVALRAQGSSDFRFDLWRDYCIPNASQYLLIGRGIAHDITDYAWLQAGWYSSPEFFYYMGNYHSGPFSLLLDTGLVGTVSFTLFFFYVVCDSWRVVQSYASHQDTIMVRYYVFLTVLMTYRFFGFYFVFGDVRASTFGLLVIAAQLRILKKNFLMESPPKAGVEIVQNVKPVQNTSFKSINLQVDQGKK